eukprot:TRINITY_DN2844_c0_g1_i3.p1 TRINITY_DN2844_c0_g1~~TRINITY_DN2844_c0_g1_i3.p1  ORF type:complete len:122 (-),score=23.46 TRINITY_DN2844_c0_g1_i3:101-466(-)
MSKPNSIFALMLESEKPESQEKFQELDEVEKEKLQRRMNKWGVKAEEYRFDRDPEYFGPVLNYLRTGKLIYPSGLSLRGLREEAIFYEISELERLISKELNQGISSVGTSTDATRFRDYFE